MPTKLEDWENIKPLLDTKEIIWSGDDYEKYFKKLITSEEGIFLTAKINNQIVGLIFGEVNIKEDWGEFQGIAVSPKFQRQGIGTKLIEEFEKTVKEKNIFLIDLYAHTNTLAKFIEKLGYEKRETYTYCRKNLK